MGYLRAIAAGCTYALIMFMVGFVVGTLRLLVLAPHLGATWAVELEVPVMLIVSWYQSRWSARKLDVVEAWESRALMGFVAFVILMVAELGVSIWIFDQSLAAHFAAYGSAAGAIGLAAQLTVATFPLLQAIRAVKHVE
jgi:hypothetical protein